MPAVAHISARTSKGDTATKGARSQGRALAISGGPVRDSVARAKPQAAAFALRQRLQRLAVLLHRRWSVPILAELLRGDTGAGGAKFITLAHRLRNLNGGREVSRESLKATLDELMKHDYVMRNPGYGHPMRPEYLLAEAGYDIAPHCRALLGKLQSRRWAGLVQRKWALPTILAIGSGLTRFGELKASHPNITARALTMALKELVALGVVERGVVHGFPPSTRYRLTSGARAMIPILAKF